MYLDHPIITATNSITEPDRIERLNRVYGYMVGMADHAHNKTFITKLAQLHDDRGTLTVFWRDQLSAEEKSFCMKAWESQIGDGTRVVEFSIMPPVAAGAAGAAKPPLEF